MASRSEATFLDGKWRWLVYVTIGVFLVIAVLEFSLRFPRWKPTLLDKNLLSVFVATTVLLGYVLRWGWRYRRNPRFWLAWSAFAFVHSAVFAFLSLYVNHWPALVLGPIIGAETVMMAVFIRWAMSGKRV